MKVLSEKDEIQALPFSETQQEAIVGYCLLYPLFFMKCYRMIKPTWFTYNPRVSVIFDQLCKFYERENRHVRAPSELPDEAFFVEMSIDEQNKYRTLMTRCMVSANESTDLPRMEKYLTAFIRVCLFKEALSGGANIFKVKGFDDAYNKTKDKLQEIEKATFEDDSMVIPFANPEIWLAEDAVEKSKIISTGSKNFDEMLQGGLYPGDTTMIMAPTNTGKTTLMLTLARHAAVQGKDVLIIMHEGKQKAIRRQLLASLVGVSKHDLVKMAGANQAFVLKESAAFLDERVTYIHYSKSMSMYMEDVLTEIRKRNDERKIKFGKGYDMIVVDYPAKQRSRILSASRAPRHEELAYIYDQHQLLGGELGTHMLLAMQTNAGGYTQNKNAEEHKQYLDLDNIGGSFAINNNMPNVIALNRSTLDKGKEILHLTILKSRDAQTHITLHTFTDYSCSLTHGDSEMFTKFGMPKFKDVGLMSSVTNDNLTYPTDTIFATLDQMRQSKQEEINRLRAAR